MYTQKNLTHKIIIAFSSLFFFQSLGQGVENQLTIEAEIIDVNCFGSNDGAIYLNISGGVAPYKIIWDNGNTENYITDLYGGLYSVTIADSENSTIKKTFRLKRPQPLSIMIQFKDISEKEINDGEITAVIRGGEQPYTFNWSNNETTQNIKNLSLGTYKLIVTDNSGCNLSIQGEIEITEKIISANKDQVSID